MMYLTKSIAENFIESLDRSTLVSLVEMNREQALETLCKSYEKKYGRMPAGIMLYMLKNTAEDLCKA